MGLTSWFKKWFERTDVEGMTIAQLQDFVLKERGTRLTPSQVKELIEGQPLRDRGMASPPVMHTSSDPVMESPGIEASVIREAVVSDSMTRDEFIRRFDASVFSTPISGEAQDES